MHILYVAMNAIHGQGYIFCNQFPLFSETQNTLQYILIICLAPSLKILVPKKEKKIQLGQNKQKGCLLLEIKY